MTDPRPDSGRGLRWPLLRLPGRKRKPVCTPPKPSLPTEVVDLMNEMDELADEGTARLRAQASARADAEPESAPLPPGVLGYGVGVFPGNRDACSGLAHTGVMTAESARREAAQYAAGARTDPYSPQHAECGYRQVEIRAVDRG